MLLAVGQVVARGKQRTRHGMSRSTSQWWEWSRGIVQYFSLSSWFHGVPVLGQPLRPADQVQSVQQPCAVPGL